MEKFIINGGKSLNGAVSISGMKNSALPVLFGTILTNDICIIENLPNISDVRVSLDILASIGASIKLLNSTTIVIDTT